MKRIIALIFAFAVCLQLCALAGAAETADVFEFGRVSVTMPYITVEIKDADYAEGAESLSAVLGEEILKINDVHPYRKGSDSVCAYALVDISGSVKGSYFNTVKESLKAYVEYMADGDQLVLITFSEEIEVVLNGEESKEEALAAIDAVTCRDRTSRTLFCEALSKAYNMSDEKTADISMDREYALVFSDGIDYQTGMTSFDEVMNEYGSHQLPVYAFGKAGSDKESTNRFSELARASGGAFTVLNSVEGFDSQMSVINDVTVLKLQAAVNVADGGTKQLSITVGDKQKEISVPIKRSVPDGEAPTVVSVSYDEDAGVIAITYSEAMNSVAAAPSAYTVKAGDGTEVEIVSVAVSAEKENTYLIKPKLIYDGAYTVSFNGIKDASVQSNPLTEAFTFVVNCGLVPETESEMPDDNSPLDESSVDESSKEEEQTEDKKFPAWGIILIIVGGVLLIAILVIVIVIAASKSRKNDASNSPATASASGVDLYVHGQNGQNRVKHHIKTQNAVRIRLRIKTGRVSEQTVEYNVVSSLIFGRSDTCDVYLDDTKLSRQHFVIENDNGTLYITDLQSRNGTVLNGIRVTGRRVLSNGDKIMAGLSDIVITIVGR